MAALRSISLTAREVGLILLFGYGSARLSATREVEKVDWEVRRWWFDKSLFRVSKNDVERSQQVDAAGRRGVVWEIMCDVFQFKVENDQVPGVICIL